MTAPQDQPPYGQQPQHGPAYDPYEGRDPYNNRGFDIPYPAGRPEGREPQVARPGSMIGALILQVVGSVPWLLLGLGLLVAPITSEEITASGVLSAPQVAQAGITAENLISVLRGFGVLFLVVPLVYILFAVVAFTGRRWARVVLAVMTAVFLVLVVIGLVGGGGASGGGTGVVLVLAVLPALGTALMFSAAANAWFASLRR